MLKVWYLFKECPNSIWPGVYMQFDRTQKWTVTWLDF